MKELQIGDVLKSSDKKTAVKIIRIKKLSKDIVVYNMEVDRDHNYFISSSTIIVHNKNITKLRKQILENKKPISNER